MNETKWLRLNYSKKDCTQLEECYLLLWSKVSRAHSDYVFLHLVFYCLVIPGRAANISIARITRVWYGKKKQSSLFVLFKRIQWNTSVASMNENKFSAVSRNFQFSKTTRLASPQSRRKVLCNNVKELQRHKKERLNKKKEKKEGRLTTFRGRERVTIWPLFCFTSQYICSGRKARFARGFHAVYLKVSH